MGGVVTEVEAGSTMRNLYGKVDVTMSGEKEALKETAFWKIGRAEFEEEDDG